jgi:hypothetical protein
VVIYLVGALLVGGPIIVITWALKKPGQQDAAVAVTVDDLLDEYEENEVAFKKKYAGQVIEVTGYERERHPNEFDKGGTTVVLGGKVKGRRVETINCNFPSGGKPVQFDHTAVIRGRCVVGDGTFHLDNCRLTGTRRDYAPQRRADSRGQGTPGPREGKGPPDKRDLLTVLDLSQRRKGFSDKFPGDSEKVIQEWTREYGGKELTITGAVEVAGRRKRDSNSEGLVVVLRGDPNAIEFVNRPPSEGGSYQREGVSDAWCWFDVKRQDEVTSVRPGQTVTVRGRFESLAAYTVTLKDCTIQK